MASRRPRRLPSARPRNSPSALRYTIGGESDLDSRNWGTDPTLLAAPGVEDPENDC